jgi:hypothetical protein
MTHTPGETLFPCLPWCGKTLDMSPSRGNVLTALEFFPKAADIMAILLE